MSKTLVMHTITRADWRFRDAAGQHVSHRDPSQPPLLALVASVQDSDDGEVARMLRMVRLDDGMQVSDETRQREGLSTRMMEEDGHPLDDVMTEFRDLLNGCDWVAAYGGEHHWKVAQIAAENVGVDIPQIAVMCLMKKSTIPCHLPTRTVGTFKTPKLTEAYEFYAGRPLAIDFTGDSQTILRQHLDARLMIWNGLCRFESGELQKAAAPVSFDATAAGAKGRWD